MPEKKESLIVTFLQIGFILLKIIAVMLLIFVFLGFLGIFLPEDIKQGNVAVIPIEGIISSGETSSFVQSADSGSIVELIEEADENNNIKAILLEINSPGGAPVATDEIAEAVETAKKPVFAVIREMGASGAFWIATSADYVFANRMSITGSIGVQASRLEFGEFLDEYNVTYRKLTAGKFKDTGTIWREMSQEEQAMYKAVLDKLHNEFIKAVAKNRKLDESFVRSLATGFVYLGSEAKELGLVDELGSKKDVLKHIEKQLNITAEPVEYKEPRSFIEEIYGLTENGFYNVGQGIGSSIVGREGITFS